MNNTLLTIKILIINKFLRNNFLFSLSLSLSQQMKVAATNLVCQIYSSATHIPVVQTFCLEGPNLLNTLGLKPKLKSVGI